MTHIQPFIAELQAKENEKWRQEVTDVRNWSTFKAREYFRADKTLKQVYESSGSLSGGEGAQLAYTVLGAAIADQLAAVFQRPALSAPDWTQVITEKRATFACTPGLARPPVEVGLAGLAIAGDYTAGDYPATLEGAIRSGLAAARLVNP